MSDYPIKSISCEVCGGMHPTTCVKDVDDWAHAHSITCPSRNPRFVMHGTPPFISERLKQENDPVNPSHYKGDTVMKIIEDFNLDFLDGQVVKYMLRCGNKPGELPLTEYKKALWYLQRKIRNLENQKTV